MWANRKQSGFTIVELLIVIIVIGILAAIIVVVYNGSQQRARNAQTISAANNYFKFFNIYNSNSNGSYPPVSDVNNNYCLNVSPAECTTSQYWGRDVATLETALKTVSPTLPVPALNSAANKTTEPVLGYIPQKSGGPTLDGSTNGFIIFVLEGGNTKCNVPSLASGSWPTFSSAPPSTGYTTTTGSTVTCWMPLAK
jgi:prepilin-type N-terminal cleavage/methylation domain-containing protein